MIKRINREIPRLPLSGSYDLTYRCNNNCRHCWLWLPENSNQKRKELTFSELRGIIDQARQMGTQTWSLSGGEPMLREDFSEIFDYITRKSISYKLNTNGTLITPSIAQLLTRPGDIMVALYGANREMNDYITRTPGSFDALMRGFAYLREANVKFTVQIVPMRDNYHQFDQMISLAQSISENIRVGAAWLWLSAYGSERRNQEIIRQRLDPDDILEVDKPGSVGYVLEPFHSKQELNQVSQCGSDINNDYLFADCIASRRDFHIDPYGGMSFCYYIKDPDLRFNLREGSFQEAWDNFIPSLKDKVRGGQEYIDNCGSCEHRNDCRWCPVYAYLEHGRYSAKVNYLCQAAAEARHYKENWKLNHVRYYQIAGITIQLSADFPLTDDTFATKYEKFRVPGPDDDMIYIKLVSGVPTLSELNLGKEVYRKQPWAIYQQHNSFVYRGITSEDDYGDPHTLAIVDRDHNKVTICREKHIYEKKKLHSLTTFVSDQILLSQALANRQAIYIHSSAIIFRGDGLLFVGHSEAGKSTIIKMLRGQGEILCDDRNVVRKWSDGFRVHGTWSHGELPDVSPAGAPLRAILFLEQASTNELVPITDKTEIMGKILSHVIKGLLTEDWWEKTLDLAGNIADEVPAFRLKFDKSGKVVDVLGEKFK